jgi:hypothetical protein
MDFDTKASNIILVSFQIKVNFQQSFFQHNYACLNEKFIQMFFVKSHEYNFSYGIEIIQSTHIQCMTKYFIKCCNYLNHFKNIIVVYRYIY